MISILLNRRAAARAELVRFVDGLAAPGTKTGCFFFTRVAVDSNHIFEFIIFFRR